MKIATFNVNGIRSRLGNLLEWLQRETPDASDHAPTWVRLQSATQSK